MRNWQKVKVENGLALFTSDALTIKITDIEDCAGCFGLLLLKDGHFFKSAFWHGQDMEIPAECYEDGVLVWERYFGAPDFPKCLNYVEWEKANVLEMTDDELNALIIGEPYSQELVDEFEWDSAYPVVSQGKIIAVHDAAWPEESGYGEKPIVNDEYIDADAEDVIED